MNAFGSRPNLKRHVVDHLAARELDAPQLRRLEAIQRRHDARPSALHYRWITSAALVLIVAGLVAFWQPSGHDMVSRIAEEVAANHMKRWPLEVRGSEVDDLQPFFKDLDFRLIRTSSAQLGEDAMLGGRYCSIQGVNAAQIRLKTAPGTASTLYQAQYDVGLFGELPRLEAGEAPLQIQARGKAVEIWVERGLLLALVRD